MKRVFSIVAKASMFYGLLFLSGVVFAQQLAFPTAEGYGKFVTGGRGGRVIEVTNLNSSGAGSFGAAISASGARTVVFTVSGTITGDFNIKNGDITIAGQTAPGDGICINGNISTNADNIIIRYLRIRHDPTVIGDAIGGRYHKNIIFDHLSTSWSADETLTLYHNENTTVQWCIIAQACEKFEGGVSVGHRFGGIWGNNYGTWHHNLIAHNDSRNPRWASGCGFNDYRNNVIYNWGYESCYGGEKVQPNKPDFASVSINMVANYYKPGPATIASGKAKTTIANPSARSSSDKGDWYVSGNYFDGNTSITSDNWKGVLGSNYNKLSTPWTSMPIKQQTAQDAYLAVLDKAGCSFPKRDVVDTDIIYDTRTGTAKYGKNGIISKPSDVGGWPVLNSLPAPTDTDHDGIPDAWEISHNLDPNKASNNADRDGDGYTNLEEYLGCLVGEFTTCDPGSPNKDCAGVVNGTAKLDNCGICTGGTTGKVACVKDCNGVNAGSAVLDACGVCTGGTTGKIACIKDCNGDFGGTAVLDNCAICTGGKTGKTACVKDCNGVNGGTAVLDACGICTGGTTGKTACKKDCNGDLNGTAVLDNCGVCTGGKSIFKLCKISLEAEDACTLEGTIDNNNAGFSGLGFANTNNAIGASATWKVNSISAQTATLTITFANGGTTNRNGDLYINGVKSTTVLLAPTGSWSTWNKISVNVSLSSGLNVLDLKATTSDGLANLDILHFSEGVSVADCIITGIDGNTNAEFKVFPNPTNNKVQWEVSQEWKLFDSRGLELASGEGQSTDLSTYAPGIYLLNINNVVVKIIRE